MKFQPLLFLLFLVNFLFQSSASCSSGQYYDGSTDSCQSCDSSCNTCIGPLSTHCTSCSSLLTLQGNICACEDLEYYQSSSGKCKSCHKSCTAGCTDSGPSSCSSCSNTEFEYLGACYEYCKADEYWNSTSLSCESCDSSCETCIGPSSSECSTCEDDEVFYKGQCLSECPNEGTFEMSGSPACRACDSSCLTCSGGATNECLKCPDNTKLESGECIAYTCDSSCLTCAGPSDEECLTCFEGNSLIEIDGGLGYCQMESSNNTSTNPPSNNTTTNNSTSNNTTNSTTNIPSNNTTNNTSTNNSTNPPSNNTTNSTIPNDSTSLKMIFLDAQIVQLGSTQNNFLIVFNSSIGGYYEEIASTMRISMNFAENQPEIDYNYSLSSTKNNQAILCKITVDGYLLSGSQVKISLNRTITTDSTQLQIKSYQFTMPLVESFTYPESTQELINTTSKTSEVVSNINSVYSIMSSFVFQSLHAIRSELIDTMLDFFIFLNIEFPPNYIQFSEQKNNIMDVIIPNALQSVSQNDKSCGPQDPNQSKRFCKYLPSGAFLENYGINITFISGMFIFMLLIEAVKGVGTSKFSVKSLSMRVLVTSSFSFRWNLLISEVISGYQELTFYALVGFVSSSEKKGVVIAAVVFVLLIFGLGFMVFLLRKLPKITKEIIIEKEKQQASQSEEQKTPHPFERFNVLFKTFKSQNLSRLFLIPLLLLRSLGFSFVLVFLSDFPVLQLAYLYISTIGIIGYMLKFTPFHEKKQLILTVLYEILLLVATGLTTVLHFYSQAHIEDLDTRTNLGFAIIYSGFGMSLLNFASFLMEILELVQKIKFRTKARKVVPMGIARASVLNFQKETLSLENNRKNFSRFSKKRFTGSTILPFAESQNDGLSDFDTPRITPRTLSYSQIQTCRKSVEEKNDKEKTSKRFMFQKENQSISLDIEGNLDLTKETPKGNYANFVELSRKPTLKFTRELNLETIEDEEAMTIKAKVSGKGSDNVFSWHSINTMTNKETQVNRRRLFHFNTMNSNINNS